jgi:acetate kinase
MPSFSPRASASTLLKFVIGSARKRVGLGWKSTRRQAARGLTKGDSKTSAWMIPTDEDLMIARHTWRLVGESKEHND